MKSAALFFFPSSQPAEFVCLPGKCSHSPETLIQAEMKQRDQPPPSVRPRPPDFQGSDVPACNFFFFFIIGSFRRGGGSRIAALEVISMEDFSSFLFLCPYTLLIGPRRIIDTLTTETHN